MSGLKQFYGDKRPEAGCDEAGRGCLAGPVYAAAVILPDVVHPMLTKGLRDSKRLSATKRKELREIILENVVSYGIASIDHHTIDKYNILQASMMAMHGAIQQLVPEPASILVDGKHFIPFASIPHHCLIKGDAHYLGIAAASILAKTERDAYMERLHEEYPHYGWKSNKGYPTPRHKEAIARWGLSPFHRRSFGYQLKMALR